MEILVNDMANFFYCMKPKALKFETREGGPLGRTEDDRFFQSGLLCPLAALSLVPAPTSGSASTWLLLTVWRYNQPSISLGYKKFRGTVARKQGLCSEACPEFVHPMGSQICLPFLMELPVVQPLHHQPAPSLEDLNMFDCKWMFLKCI